MKIVDANVLLYAVNRDSVNHVRAREWWEAALSNEDERIGLPWLVLLAFVRIATNPRVFAEALPVDVALRTVDAWLAQDNVRIVREREDHWQRYRSLLMETGTAGNLASDVHLAALAFTHNAVLVSFDNDFARFTSLRWENPGHIGPRKSH